MGPEFGAWTDPALRRFVADDPACVAVIPVGSIEQHGPHLPVSTDVDIASAVAGMVAEKNGYLLLPAIAYGVSYEHGPLINLSIGAETLGAILRDLCMSLHANGIRAAAVINGHHGNIGALGSVEDSSTDSVNPVAVSVFHYWRFLQCELGHAGFVETSMMLAISADAVRMDLAERGLLTKGLSKEQKQRLSDLASSDFLAATGNGIWGDPLEATREDGLRMLEEAADGICAECKSRLGT